MNSEEKESYVNPFTQRREEADERIDLIIKREKKEPMTQEEIDRLEYLIKKDTEFTRELIRRDKHNELTSLLKFIGIVVLIAVVSAVLLATGIVHKR